MTEIVLRDYQDQTLDRVEKAEAREVRKQLIVAATGLGKTIIFTALAKRRGTRALVLAHRDELVNQAVKSIREWWPDVDVGIVKADENDVRHHVVVASVQTLARERRLAQLLAPFSPDGMTLLGRAEPFGLVIIDEAHHATADSYGSIIEGLRAGQPDGPLLVGVTATPDRGDGKGLDDVFDEIVANWDLLWGIGQGYLSELRGLRVKVSKLDLDKVRVRQGDYDQGQAGRALRDAGAEDVILQAWRKHAEGRRTLVFTPTVETAQLVADRFVRDGIAAAMVHGGTPKDERRQILRDYSAGVIQVLANCAVLTEGYDEPRTDCVVMARPTKSRALYTQCVGRGTRKHPDKTDCLVLDIVGATEQHSLVTIPSLFGLGGAQAERMGDGSADLSEMVEEFQQEQIRLGKLRAEDAELFHKVKAKGVNWITIHADDHVLRRYIRPLPPKERGGAPEPTVVLAQKTEDTWTAGLLMPNGEKRVLMADVSMETAQGVAEDYVRKNGTKALTNLDAPWRKKKPSQKQRDMAAKWKIEVPKDATAGDVSDLIDQRIARVRVEKQLKPRHERTNA